MSNPNKRVQLALFIALTGLILGIIFYESYKPTTNIDEYLLDDFNTLDKWTLESDENTSASIDETHSTSSPTIKLTATNSPAMMSRSTSFNLDYFTRGEVSFYVENKENVEYLSLYFATDPELNGPFGYVVFENYQLTDGWNTLPFSVEQLLSPYGLDTKSSVSTLQVLLQPKNGEASIYLDSLKLINADKANVVFSIV